MHEGQTYLSDMSRVHFQDFCMIDYMIAGDVVEIESIGLSNATCGVPIESTRSDHASGSTVRT